MDTNDLFKGNGSKGSHVTDIFVTTLSLTSNCQALSMYARTMNVMRCVLIAVTSADNSTD